MEFDVKNFLVRMRRKSISLSLSWTSSMMTWVNSAMFFLLISILISTPVVTYNNRVSEFGESNFKFLLHQKLMITSGSIRLIQSNFVTDKTSQFPKRVRMYSSELYHIYFAIVKFTSHVLYRLSWPLTELQASLVAWRWYSRMNS